MKKIYILFLLFSILQVPSFAYDSERANIYYTNGVTYFKDKKYSSAIQEFKKVSRVRPYDKTVQNALAMAYLSRAQYYKDTEKAYKKAINDLRSAILYLKYWNGIDETKKTIIQNAENELASLKNSHAPLKTADAAFQEAKSIRAQGELAASIYEFSSLYNNQKYGISAYSTASDIYKALGNQKMSIECIRSAISASPKDGMLHFKYALLLEEINNNDAAMDEYSRALEYSDNNKELLSSLQELWMGRSAKNGKDSQALINLGAVLQKQNEFELAKSQYIKARQINPNDPVILINLASVYTALNDYDNAIKIYDEILLKNPSDLSARFYKGKLYEKKGETSSAIAQYEEILKLKKDDANASYALNSVLSGLSGDKLSNYLYDKAQKNPSSYDAQFKYAFEMHKNKKYQPAIEYYKKAIALDNTHSEPFINLAQIFTEQENYNAAKNVVAHGLSVMPDNSDLKKLQETVEKTAVNQMYFKGSELYNAKNYAGALEYYINIPYQTPETLTMIANCYYELRQGDKAIEYYNKVLEKSPGDENAMYMIASLYANSKREDNAREYLNKILAINPNNKDAQDALSALNAGKEGSLLDSAISLYENKDFDGALDVLKKISDKNAYACYYRGVIYEEKGELESAISEYKKSIIADSNFALGYYMTAVALDTKENYKEAVTYYDKYIKLRSKEGVEDDFSKYAKARNKELRDYLSQK